MKAITWNEGLLLFTILLIMICFASRIYKYDAEVIKVSKSIPMVKITPQENLSLTTALANWSRDNSTPLDNWIKDIEGSGRRGVLPQLPRKYSNENILWVDGRAILLDPTPPSP